MEDLNLALVQMTATDNVLENTEKIISLIGKINKESGSEKELKPKLAFFPENSLFLRIQEGSKIQCLEIGDDCFKKINNAAIENQITIHLGSVALKENDKVYNASVWIYPQAGQVVASYRKIHLFDISLEGRAPIRESDVFTAGDVPVITKFQDWLFGESICYDIRFSELYQHYAQKNVDAILIPSSFLVETGKAHWESLLRARAIESQCYVIASAQVGPHKNSVGHTRNTFGHSMVVSPWGEVMVNLKEQEGIGLFSIKKDFINGVKRQIPMAMHRKLGKI